MNFRPWHFALTCWFGLAAHSGVAYASPTRSFVLDSASVLSEGKLDGTSVESDGSLTPGAETRRTDLPGVASAKSLLVLPDGSAYIGTGNDGKIYQYRDGVARLFADTKQLLVSSLARDARGTLYAGTLPKGKIFAIDPKGEAREFSSPAGAEHIWALLYDDKQQTLFAATGPHGKLFAIDPKGKADVYYDSGDSHILALARGEDGSLYVGTSDRALLVRVRGVNRAEVLYDFDASEVSALALRKGVVAAVANQFPKATPPKLVLPGATSDANSALASNPLSAPPTPLDKAQAGKGQLFVVQPDGTAERWFSADEGHLTTVEWADDQTLYVGTGKEGHIHRVRGDHDHALLVDVDERQILASALVGPHPLFVTGDGAAVYALRSDKDSKYRWTSKVLDAGGHARFGQLDWRGRGALSFATRTGNTEKPDATWSAWSSPLTAAGPIASPSARFLQVRAELGGADSLVYAIEAFYLPQNQAALVTEISIEPPRPKPGRGGSAGSIYKLRWKTENPDNDSLRYRLYYRQEQSQTYRTILRESEPFLGTEYAWDTEPVPDGYYRIRVSASDEIDNPAAQARKTQNESEPFLVDNRPPLLPELRVQDARVVGKASDDFGPITKLEFSLDGLEWRLVRPDDGLLDTREERFSVPLSELPHGDHLLAVRATDARGNTVTREVPIHVP
jgi:hypothetical protein